MVYSQWGISLPSRDNSAPPTAHGTFALLKPPSERTWHLTWCCLLQVHQGGPVGSGVSGQLGSRCCGCRWRCCAHCCSWARSRCVVGFGVFPTGYFAHLRRFGMRSCAWMCFGVFPMGYFLALGGLQLTAGPRLVLGRAALYPCRAPPSWRCSTRCARA